MREIIIRKATEADCARMLELIRELALYEKAPEEVTVSFEHFVASGFGEKPVWWAYVAECRNDDEMPQFNGTIVGFALYYIRYSTWKGQRLYLEDILVTEAYRGKGVGKLLFDQLLQLVEEQGFSGMVWQVLDWNEPAIQFYKKYPAVQFDTGWINVSLPGK